jgi:predicted DsbA family dithiol-disulfide isomerase
LRPETPDEGLPLPTRVKAFMANPNNPLISRARALGLKMNFDRAMVPSTRRAHQAAEWSRTKGAFDVFHLGLLERYWVKGEDLHDFEVLRATAADAGLDGQELQAEVESKRWEPDLKTALDAAHHLGVHAVPTFLVGDQFFIEGAQDENVFARAFETLGFAPRSKTSVT